VSRFGCGVLFGFLLCAGSLAQDVTVAPCGVAGVTVAGASSAEYFETVDEVLGATRSPSLNAWLPYGVTLTNRTSQHIAAIAVRWVVTNHRGQASPVTVTHSMFDQPRLQVAPGKSVVALPVALLGTAPLPRQFQLTPPPGVLPVQGHLAEFQGARKVQATLDGVVFASGQFVGPDNAKEFEELVAETTVPAHIASTVLAMNASGEAIGTVAAWLEANSKLQTGDRNAQVTARTAKLLLDDYKRGGEALLYEVAQGYAQGPGIKLYR